MSKDIFKMKDIGEGLQGIFSIAMGSKEEGLRIFKKYLDEENKEGKFSCN
jgi:hypothetical protein